MRFSPTFGYIAWAVLGIALVGCAASAGEDEEEGATPATEGTGDSSSQQQKQKSRPKFEANIPGDGRSADGPDPAPEASDQCIDEDDPGGSLSLATDLPEIDDCDENYKSIRGVMKGAVDVDYYRLSARDKWQCRKDTDFQAETAGTELCVFMRCKNATVNAVTGCAENGGVLSTDEETGVKGCCAMAPGHAVPDWDCDGVFDPDAVNIQLRVRQPSGNECLPYSVKYRF